MDVCIAHRGPDDAGIMPLADVAGSTGAFAHRRLAILDVSAAGHQPMSTPDGRWTINFNGEIYNFRQLRDELARDGVQFRTQTDTEVILHGVGRHGRSFLAKMRGMFAFALWDRDERRGYLVRDGFGIKPMFVAQAAGTVYFASEVRAILASGAFPRRLSRDAIGSYLRYGAPAEPLTMVEGVAALPPGTIATIELRDTSAHMAAPETFTRGPIVPEGERITDRNVATTRIREVLRDSVRHHLVSDVPVGLFLSGGVDSSAIAALAHEVSDVRLDSFTMAFKERRYSEAQIAREVADRFGTRHHEITISGADLLGMLPQAFQAMDQPSMDGLNTYAISRATRAFGLKVVLSGLGGDEVFGGYPSFQRAVLADRMRWIRPVARSVVDASGLREIAAEKLKLLLAPEDPAAAAYRASRILFTRRRIAELSGKLPDDAQRTPPSGLPLFARVSWYEFTGYMLNTLLRDTDVFSMACGLELRVPFVDMEVARLAASIDMRLLGGARASKSLLIDALGDLLPESVWRRPKQGFTLPFAHWLRAELKAETEGTFTEAEFERVGLNPDVGRRVWSAFLAGESGVTWSRPWSLYTLLRWAREHDLSVTPGAEHRPRRVPLGGRTRGDSQDTPLERLSPTEQRTTLTPDRRPNIHFWAPGIFGFRGGIQVYQHDLLHGLRSLVPAARIRVFSKNDSDIPEVEKTLRNVEFHCAGASSWPLHTARFTSQIVTRALSERPDLVVVGHLNFGAAALTLKRVAGVPFWVFVYGIEAWDLDSAIARATLREADRIISISHHTREQLLRQLPLDPRRILLLPPTFDDSSFRPAPKPGYLLQRYDLTPEQPVILSVGRLAGAERYKGYDQILKALTNLRTEFADIRYIIAGTGDDRARIEQEVNRLGLASHVTLAGFVPDAELCDHYNLCDVFAMPSKREGFGIVYVEAMACGKPVLGGNQDGAVDALANGELGSLVDPDDVGMIEERVAALLRREYSVPLMRDPQALRRAAVERFGPDAFLRTLREHLESAFPAGPS